MAKQSMFVGDMFDTQNYGPIEIKKYTSCYDIDVVFLNTGTLIKAAAGNIRSGKIRDPYQPDVCGVGFMGVGPHTSIVNGKKTKTYNVWQSMIARCYNTKDAEYELYGARGVYVCEEWLNFQIFAEWYENNKFEGCHVDKDTKGGTCYSEETCIMLSGEENAVLATAKWHEFVDLSGSTVKVYNLSEFAREHGYNLNSLFSVLRGKRKEYMGLLKREKNV